MRLDRLTERKQFLAAAEKGRRFRSYAFTAQVRDRSADEPGTGLRLGLTASRKVGNAVVRNRIRRRLRAAAAEALAGSADRPLDLVVVARTEAANARFDRMVQDLALALDRARPVSGEGRGRKKTPPGGSARR